MGASAAVMSAETKTPVRTLRACTRWGESRHRMSRPVDDESIVIYITALLNQVGIGHRKVRALGGLAGIWFGCVEKCDYTAGRRDVRIGDGAAVRSAAINWALLAHLCAGNI
jgi:hypothetical protein